MAYVRNTTNAVVYLNKGFNLVKGILKYLGIDVL